MPASVQLTTKQKKKEMKRVIGEEAAASVRENFEFRKEERRVVRTAGQNACALFFTL
jgi:hypothetical protein